MSDLPESHERMLLEIEQLRKRINELQGAELKFQKAEQELRQAKEYAEFVFRSTPNAIFTIDPNRSITSWNNKAEEITGYSFKEIIGKQCTVFADSPCKDMCAVFSDNVEKPIFNAECSIKRKDGKIIVISKNAEILKDEHGNTIGAIESFEDITGRKNEEQSFQKSYQTLEMQIRERTAELSKMNEALLVEIMQRKKVQKNFEDGNEKLQRVLNETISALAFTVEKRDPYTAGHQERVTHLAEAIAREMKLPADQILGVKTAAMIHDIGKICVPAEILSKPSKLTTYEFNIIKAHPEVGYDILKEIEFPWPVSSIVVQHHERMDGSGYPNSLKGNEILIEAHILIVADVVEAMASHRPYRPALGIERALDEIINKKGILYNVDVVDACIKLFMEQDFKIEQIV
ncbi:MAG: HD domain-containing protein [Candidatus Omnitrophica bacterium]|nr:HD domain-containing protein [Candidatus Omnitrophota bacterium]